MNSLNNNQDLPDVDFELPAGGSLKPHSSTDFSPAAVAKVIAAINGTLFTGDDSTTNFSPLPCSEAKIHCLPCMLQGTGVNGYTIYTYFQNHGNKCKCADPFYQFYCQHLVNDNKIKPPSGVIPMKHLHLMQLSSNVEDDDDLSIETITGNKTGTGNFSDHFYSTLSNKVKKLIKESIEAELDAKPAAVASVHNNEVSKVTKAMINSVQPGSNKDVESSSVSVGEDPKNQETQKRKASGSSLEPVLRMATCSNKTASELSSQF